MMTTLAETDWTNFGIQAAAIVTPLILTVIVTSWRAATNLEHIANAVKENTAEMKEQRQVTGELSRTSAVHEQRLDGHDREIGRLNDSGVFNPVGKRKG